MTDLVDCLGIIIVPADALINPISSPKHLYRRTFAIYIPCELASTLYTYSIFSNKFYGSSGEDEILTKNINISNFQYTWTLTLIMNIQSNGYQYMRYVDIQPTTFFII